MLIVCISITITATIILCMNKHISSTVKPAFIGVCTLILLFEGASLFGMTVALHDIDGWDNGREEQYQITINALNDQIHELITNNGNMDVIHLLKDDLNKYEAEVSRLYRLRKLQHTYEFWAAPWRLQSS